MIHLQLTLLFSFIGYYIDTFEYFGWHLKGYDKDWSENGILWHLDNSEQRMRNIFRKNCRINFGDIKKKAIW